MKRNLKLKVIPRSDEFLFFDDQYYKVLNVVHKFNDKQDIFVVVEIMGEQPKK